jgi:hypothetical protein
MGTCGTMMDGASEVLAIGGSRRKRNWTDSAGSGTVWKLVLLALCRDWCLLNRSDSFYRLNTERFGLAWGQVLDQVYAWNIA